MLKYNNLDYIFFDKDFIKLYNFFKKKKNITNIVILLDNNIKKYCLKFLLKKVKLIKKSKIIRINSGENKKNIFICIKIFKIFNKLNVDKNSILINFGGGVITDLGGFIGSIFKRGLNFINIPTTLLSMVDASIGGKNGINFNNYKNEIGLINNPIMTLINTNFIKTLPKYEIFSGLGELLKYGLIYDKKYWNFLKKKNFLNFNKIFWDNIIYKAILIKKKIVDKDPKELLGIRKILNFGHTIGHAIESFYLYKKKKISHGKAISLGIICESWISKKINNLKKKEYIEICNIITKYFKIKKIIKKKNFNYLYKIIKKDKKNFNKNIYFSLLRKIGKCDFNKKVNKKLIYKSIKKMNNFFFKI
ncbi:MAG: 3-dehydroquinate synthase [Candidatus Shikimatogenerans bostrichidophilus]|nr:MAG: 3-dehydroquinate synthase [Candidatus Shikimatogenerans bostrichidophilus]